MCNQIVVVRTFAAPAKRVFDAWISARSLVAPVTRVEMDAVEGGRISLEAGDSAEGKLQGVFLRVESSARLRYTWHWIASPEETIVDVRFHDLGPETVVEVTHTGFLNTESQSRHLQGWVAYLDGLEQYV